MNTPTIIQARQHSETSSKDSPSAPKKKTFREFFETKVEKAEERETKKRSIFDIAANLVPSIAKAFSIDNAVVEEGVSALSKKEIEWIMTEAASAITHCISSGVKETTLKLDAAGFQNSPLFGSELVIKEFSTAPLSFNVEIRCSPTALAFLQPHLPSLAAAFHTEQKRPYAIHRIEASLDDRSEFYFQRKPAADSGHNDQGERD